jgi:tRNA dimethylallyltransferase
MCSYIKGDISRQAAIDLIKQNTRRYAKRQLTWFRSEPETHWIDMQIHNSASAAEVIAASLVKQ